MLVSVIPEFVIAEIPFLIFAPRALTPPSTRRFLKSFPDVRTPFCSFFSADLISGVANGLRKLNGVGSPKRGKNPPNCIILDNWVFYNFVLVNEPLSKALQILETSVLVSNNLCGKLALPLELPLELHI